MFRGSSHCSTSPPLHRRIFTMSTQDLPQREPLLKNYNSTLGAHYSSLKYNLLYTRGIGTKPNHNHLYTRGTRHKAKTQPQSPLHKRDRNKAKTQPQSPIHKRDEHKPKTKKRLQHLLDLTLVDLVISYPRIIQA